MRRPLGLLQFVSIALCFVCYSNHGTSPEVKDWRKLQYLRQGEALVVHIVEAAQGGGRVCVCLDKLLNSPLSFRETSKLQSLSKY